MKTAIEQCIAIAVAFILGMVFAHYFVPVKTNIITDFDISATKKVKSQIYCTALDCIWYHRGLTKGCLDNYYLYNGQCFEKSYFQSLLQ